MPKTMNKRILIVDDEAMITQILSKRLDASGYDTFTAYDGEQCLNMTQEIKPELILLDIIMPHGDGIETFKKLKANPDTKNIPVIFVTAYDDKDTKNEISELRPDGFFVKPFDGSKLLNRIDELIGA